MFEAGKTSWQPEFCFTPHPPAPTSPENNYGSRAAWTKVDPERATGRNCSNRRNTENYGIYRSEHFIRQRPWLSFLVFRKQETLIWEANGEGMKGKFQYTLCYIRSNGKFYDHCYRAHTNRILDVQFGTLHAF